MSLKHATVIPIAKPLIDEEEIDAVEAVLRSGVISQGEKVDRFEEAYAAFIGTQYAIAVNSGTAALYIALLANGIGAEDEVITTPFTFIATSNAVLLTGAKPVFADIDPYTFNIDPDQVLSKITPRTKAIIPVHLYGQPCDMKTLMEIADKHGLLIIEDACQAHGAEFDGKKVGSFGTGCFSFYSTKNMTTGEGGMITTNRRDTAEKARLIRSHGQKQRYYHSVIGYNYRMTDMAAAIGICQLRKLARFNKRRLENAGFLTDKLGDIEGFILPGVSPYAGHVFHQYTVRVTDHFDMPRDNLKEALRSKGVVAEVYYPLPIHKQPLYRDLGYDDYLPISEKAASEVISLPVHPSLTEEDLQYVVVSIRSCREIV